MLGDSPWGVRDSVPLTPPATIRAVDSVQRLFAAGRPSAGLADTLAQQGISYVVVRNDLDPDTSRSARPILVHRAIDGSPGLTKVAQFGDPVGAGTVPGFVADSDLRPRYPAVEIYRVASDERLREEQKAGAANPGTPYVADAAALPRIDGGPEALLRLAERRRLQGQPPLGPALLTTDAQRAGLPVPLVTVTDTPLVRETDYGRVDDHSSAIRAPGDQRHTFNRVPDYPADGQPVYGDWIGGRLTVSSSAADSTALPNVSPATSPAATIDGDPATSWVSNALQSAVGQWLQVDFDNPITNATITITPSATAVGAQVRKIQIATANGTTTVRYDKPGQPLMTALPYGETPWVRVTAVGTDDGSAGVQFGITDLAITQYDANGFAHPVDLRHTVVVPAPPAAPGSNVAGWDLGTELLGRSGCAEGPDQVRCAATMALASEEPVNLSRMLTVPEPVTVTPTVWVRPRQGPKLADLIAQPGAARASGDADVIDVDGSAFAAADGDPRTSWIAPQNVVHDRTPPTLTLKLPRPTEVTGLRLTSSASSVPAHPRLVAVDLGDGPQVRPIPPSSDSDSDEPRRRQTAAMTLTLKPRVTDTIKISILDWDDVIDRTALGFDQLKPPGIAEIAALGADGKPIAPADAARNQARPVDLECGRGPTIAIAGRFVHTSLHTTVAALLAGEPIEAQPCEREPIALPAGKQELLISPGEGFVVDGAQLVTARATPAPAAVTTVQIGAWGPDRREVRTDSSPNPRVLVVPESVNPGWLAHTADGTRLTPVVVNGWQQGWVLPAGTGGTITLTFPSNGLYRAGLGWGLALLPLLALLALLRPRREVVDEPARPWRLPPTMAAVAVLAAGWLIAGIAGVVVFGAVAGCPVRASPPASALGCDHARHHGDRLHPRRRGAVPSPMAFGGRIRRALVGCSAAGAHRHRRARGVGDRTIQRRRSAPVFPAPQRDPARRLDERVAHRGDREPEDHRQHQHRRHVAAERKLADDREHHCQGGQMPDEQPVGPPTERDHSPTAEKPVRRIRTVQHQRCNQGRGHHRAHRRLENELADHARDQPLWPAHRRGRDQKCADRDDRHQHPSARQPVHPAERADGPLCEQHARGEPGEERRRPVQHVAARRRVNREQCPAPAGRTHRRDHRHSRPDRQPARQQRQQRQSEIEGDLDRQAPHLGQPRGECQWDIDLRQCQVRQPHCCA